MKRYALIFVATLMIAKIFAASMMKLMPANDHFIFEKNPFNHIISLFNNNEKSNNVSPQPKSFDYKFAPRHVPVPSFKQRKAKPAYLLAAEKKAESDRLEAERRKARKKKLEEVNSADKKPEDKAPDNKQAQVFIPPTYMPMVNLPLAKVQMGVPTATASAKPTTPATAQAPGTIVATTTQNVDLHYWTQQLLTNPTGAELKLFLALYKGGRINSVQYYSVIKSLQKSSNPAARNLAVLGASVEPNAEAFQILADESYNETTSSIQTLAIQRLQVYANQNYFTLISQAMTSGADLYSKVAGAAIVDQVAKTLIASPQSIPAPTKALLSQFAADFSSYLQSGGTTQQLAASFQQALTDVNAVLGIVS